MSTEARTLQSTEARTLQSAAALDKQINELQQRGYSLTRAFELAIGLVSCEFDDDDFEN